MMVRTTVTPNLENGDIQLDVTTTIDGRVESFHREVVNMKEAATREALIKLGWKPPEPEAPRLFPRVCGVYRPIDSPMALHVVFTRAPTDDELRKFQDWIR